MRSIEQIQKDIANHNLKIQIHALGNDLYYISNQYKEDEKRTSELNNELKSAQDFFGEN